MIIISPTAWDGGRKNAELILQVGNWNRQTNLGVVFDSNSGFILPSGAVYAPDVSWILLSRWQALTLEERESFAPVVPDFVIELRSKSDSLKTLQAKMQEYIDNGCRLGWLINPQDKQVEIYRLSSEKEVLNNPQELSGEDVLPSLVLDLKEIF